MEEERVGVRAGKLALDVVEKCAGLDIDLDLPLDRALKRTRERWALGPSTRSIVAAASSRGIPSLRLNERSLVMLGTASTRSDPGDDRVHDGAARRRDRGRQEPHEEAPRRQRRAGAEGLVVVDEEDAIDVAHDLGWPVVVKPLDASHGRGVLTNIRSEEELRLAYRDARKFRDDVIVEQFLEGHDFRFLVIAGRFICAAQRVPAFVVGDGKRSIAELVEESTSDSAPRHRAREDPDEDRDRRPLARAPLARGMTPKSLPGAGETVYLKATANLSTGGISRDVTDSVHPPTST
jgi:cyanophycin synthetase